MTTPSYIAWHILEYSKVYMQKFVFEVLKPHFGKKCEIIYLDTDGLVVKFKGLDIMQHLKDEPLNSWLDLSNFKDEKLRDESKKKMGYFKIETGDVPICEVIALQPKLYSVLTAECGEHTIVWRGTAVNNVKTWKIIRL